MPGGNAMKRLLTLLLISLFFLSINIPAQNADTSGMNDQPGFLVLSQNIVPMAEMQTVLQQGDSLAAPVLDELVDEGLLYGWGVLTHAWGDEYNYNIYYIAKDHASFVKAFDEFVKRMGERHPDSWRKVVQHLKAHKDNMYSIRKMSYRGMN